MTCANEYVGGDCDLREHITSFEQALLEATLAFANLRRIRSTQQVEDLFRRVTLTGQRFKTVRPKDVPAFYHDQAELRRWLEKIAYTTTDARKTIGAEVAERLGTVPTRATFDGHRMKTEIVAPDGVQASYSYAVGLLLDETRGLTTRLGQCGYCGRFNLTIHGKPRMHCSEDHRRHADAHRATERMRKLRAEKAGREYSPRG